MSNKQRKAHREKKKRRERQETYARVHNTVVAEVMAELNARPWWKKAIDIFKPIKYKGHQ